MKLVNFDDCPTDYTRAYGGMAGRKVPIIYQGEEYLLKMPGNLRDKELRNVELSYSNSPFSEYIGSHIYEMLGIDVHKTLLGTYHQGEKEKIVCACRDFEQAGGRLQEFRELKVSFLGDVVDSNGNETDGNGTDLIDTLQSIRKHPILNQVKAMERFWDMFVVDALIGNPDRNNGNWGILVHPDKKITLAPVYDNGSCLNFRWSDAQMAKYLTEKNSMETQAYKGKTCIFKLHEKSVNPYHIISQGEFPECDDAIKRIVPRIDLAEIKNMIEEIPALSTVRKEYYNEILRIRVAEVLQPSLRRVNEKELQNDLSYIFGSEMKDIVYREDWKGIETTDNIQIHRDDEPEL